MWERCLYQGCHPDVYGWPKVWQEGIDIVVDVDGYEPVNLNQIPKGKIYLHWKIEDGDLPDLKDFNILVDFTCSALSRGKKVLVHCAAGQNRSALLTAAVLYKKYFAPEGKSGRDVYQYIKERNPLAFTNPVFKNFVLGSFQPTQSHFMRGLS